MSASRGHSLAYRAQESATAASIIPLQADRFSAADRSNEPPRMIEEALRPPCLHARVLEADPTSRQPSLPPLFPSSPSPCAGSRSKRAAKLRVSKAAEPAPALAVPSAAKNADLIYLGEILRFEFALPLASRRSLPVFPRSPASLRPRPAQCLLLSSPLSPSSAAPTSLRLLLPTPPGPTLSLPRAPEALRRTAPPSPMWRPPPMLVSALPCPLWALAAPACLPRTH